MKTNKAFTLIELLVVVLIIGILAAIAVPQYQKAVMKSRLAELQITVKNLYQDAEIYRLNNGSFPNSFEDLDIQLGEIYNSNSQVLNIQNNIVCNLWIVSNGTIACFYPFTQPYKVYVSLGGTSTTWKCCWKGENEEIKNLCQNYFPTGEYLPNAPQFGFESEQCIRTPY